MMRRPCEPNASSGANFGTIFKILCEERFFHVYTYVSRFCYLCACFERMVAISGYMLYICTVFDIWIAEYWQGRKYEMVELCVSHIQ